MHPRKTARPPLHASFTLAACVLALSLAFAGVARAQDDDEDDDDPAVAPLVIDIEGPCVLTLEGQSVPCEGVAFMVFPSNHRIDFTAITENSGWAFSGDDDDNNPNGRYALKLDSVLNPASGRLDAAGRCEMQLAADHRTVTSLTCLASTQDGDFTLKASGTIEVEQTGNDQDDGPDDEWDDGIVS
jgi:hypothetical protein